MSERDLEQELLIAAAESDSRYQESLPEEPVEREEEEKEEEEEVKQPEPIPQYETVLLKKKHEDAPTEEVSAKRRKSNNGYAGIVATHYNSLEEKGLDERSKSRIFHLRNFHNWIKSMMINEHLGKIKSTKRHNSPVRVHDMCSGKGGDLLKWKKANISHLICSDIADVSLEQCKIRYNHMKERSQRDRHSQHVYSIEYVHADCSRVRTREKFHDPSMKLDLVSCQFAFHYGFESLPQAECMLRNAAECLRPGGFFIGTIPDANDIIARARREEQTNYGNNVYSVTLDFDVKKPPLFGARYNFSLDGVVDCPEFLVHFPTLVKLAKKFGLKLVKKEKFYDFFQRMKNEGRQLLYNMKSLEAYPPYETQTLSGDDDDDYSHAREFISKLKDGNTKIGTLSKSEWEASSIYITFVFEKVKNTWNTDGTPVYDI